MLERGGRGEIQQHVAVVLIYRKAGVVGSRGGDRLAHTSVGRDEANGYRYYTQQDVIWIEFLFADIALAVASVWFLRCTVVYGIRIRSS